MTRSSDGDTDRLGRLRSAAAAVDTTRLKRVGVVTYFGVYALIALGGWRALVRATQRLPRSIQPPALGPLHVLFGLPRSVAWSVVSLSATGLALGLLAAIHVGRARREEPPSLAAIGERSWRDRWPGPADLRRRVPEPVGRVLGSSSRSSEPSLSVLDGGLVAPVAPLSLPDASGQHPTVVPTSHLDAEGFTMYVATGTGGSEVTDGGPSVAVSSATRRADGATGSTPGESGPERSDGAADSTASWPAGWRGGDAL